jgi:hypothetical protein
MFALIMLSILAALSVFAPEVLFRLGKKLLGIPDKKE